jgi:hypothetical protein
MTAKSDTFENDLLKLIFQGTAIANLAQNNGTSPLASLYFALHSADPGDAGTMATSEVAYTGYARKAVARSTGGFTITGNSCALAADVDFAACTAGTVTATHFSVGVGTTAGGADKILYKGAISPTIAIAAGVIPRLTTGTTITEE